MTSFTGDNIVIYVDGGTRGNGQRNNIGAWAYYVETPESTYEDSKVALDTTNNIQELLAVINALESLITTDTPVVVYSDSKYVIDGITSWRFNWIKNNWQTSNKKPVANKEYWQRLIELSDCQKFIKFKWVRGHQNNSSLNDYVDSLVNEAMDNYIVIQRQ